MYFTDARGNLTNAPQPTLYGKSDLSNHLVTRTIDRKGISNEPIEKKTYGPNKIVDRRLARALRAISSGAMMHFSVC
jgi:hypothetical protein